MSNLRTHCSPKLPKFSSIFFASKSFIVICCIFMFMIRVNVFKGGVKFRSIPFCLFAYKCPSIPSPFIKNAVLLPLDCYQFAKITIPTLTRGPLVVILSFSCTWPDWSGSSPNALSLFLLHSWYHALKILLCIVCSFNLCYKFIFFYLSFKYSRPSFPG